MKKYKKQQLFFLHLAALCTLLFSVFFIYFFTQPQKSNFQPSVLGTNEETSSSSSYSLETKILNTETKVLGLESSYIDHLASPKNYIATSSPDKSFTAIITNDNLTIVNKGKKEILTRNSSDLQGAKITINEEACKNLFFWVNNSLLSYPVFSQKDDRFVAHLLSVHSLEINAKN